MSDESSNMDKLYEYIDLMLESTKDRDVTYMDSVDALIAMKHAQSNSRFNATGINIYVCILGDQIHCEEARRLEIPCMDEEDMKKLLKDVTLVKNLAEKYDAFIASDTIIDQIPELLGPGLNKAGKTPTRLTHEESMAEKVEEVKSAMNIKMKKLLCLVCLDGNWPQNVM